MDFTRRNWIASAGSALLLGGGALAVGRSARAREVAPRAAGARTVVLGQSVPLTGAASEIGAAFAAGCKLFAGEFNDSPAAAGIQLKLVQLDDGYDAARAAA